MLDKQEKKSEDQSVYGINQTEAAAGTAAHAAYVLGRKLAQKQKEIKKLDSEAKKALNNSYDAKAQASEASYVATKAKDQASEANSKVDELSSHDKKVDTKI